MVDIIQVMNKRIGRYVKIDRDKGKILAVKKTKGPFKGIKIIKKK